MNLKHLGAITLRPVEALSPSAWAEKHRILTKGQSSIPGHWRNANAPYLVPIMDLCGVPGLSVLTVVKPAQVGVSEAFRNVLGWIAHTDPDPVGIALPDERKGRKIVDNRLLPMFRSTPVLQELLTPRTTTWSRTNPPPQRFSSSFNVGRVRRLDGRRPDAPRDLRRVRQICPLVRRAGRSRVPRSGPAPAVQGARAAHHSLHADEPPGRRLDPLRKLADSDSSTSSHVRRAGSASTSPSTTCGSNRGPDQDKRDQAAFIRLNRAAWLECPECKGRIDRDQK